MSGCAVMGVQSWMYIVNRRGLSKQPRGAPVCTRVEEVWLPISNVWGLFVRKYVTHVVRSVMFSNKFHVREIYMLIYAIYSYSWLCAQLNTRYVVKIEQGIAQQFVFLLEGTLHWCITSCFHLSFWLFLIVRMGWGVKRELMRMLREEYEESFKEGGGAGWELGFWEIRDRGE